MTEPARLQPADRKLPPAPAHFSAARRKLWAELLGRYELEPHELELLRLALEALDRAEEARAAIAKDGAYPAGRYGPRAHPALAIERDAAIRATRIFRELGLPVEEPASPTALGRRRGGGRR